MAFIAILWILSAVACALIAGGKNRNVFGWFFIGLVTGVFGTLVLAFLPALSRPGAPTQLR